MSTSYHHGHLREALTTAGREALRTATVEDISLRELARALGVSHAAPYRHFPDRHDFVVAVAASCQREFVDAQRRAVDRTTGAIERLIALGEAYVGYAVAEPHAFALIFDPEVSPPGAPPEELATAVNEHADLLQRLVADALHARAVSDQAWGDIVAASLWSQVHGLSALVRAGRLPADVVPQVLRAVVRPAGLVGGD